MGGRPNPTISVTSQDNPDIGGEADGGCPAFMSASIAGPTTGIVPGSWLDVQLDRSASPYRAVLVDAVSTQIVGALMGLPNLALLLRCLEQGVAYRAYVAAVAGGRIDVTLARQ